MRFRVSLLVLLMLPGLAPARGDEGRARALAPFLDSDVIAVGHVDLAKLDADRLIRRLIPDKEEAGEASAAVAPWFAALRQAGARDLFVLVVLPELMSPSPMPFSVVVPLEGGADAKAIGQLLCGGGAVQGPARWPTCATVHGAVFAGTNEALERVRQVTRIERPELGAALAALGDSQAELVLLPSADSRKVIEELLPVLPQELGGGPITILTRGMKWAAVGLDGGDEPRASFLVRASDPASVQALSGLGNKLLAYLKQSKEVRRIVPDFDRLADDLKTEIGADRISATIDAARASAWATALLKPMRANAARTQCVNNLKQIGLALHNYYSAHNAFPPAYTVDKGGKPLLSWRVLILPYLEQEALFKEFHLDEPWDSPHNKALIERIPPTYLCPDAGSRKADRGKTTYLAPRGKSAAFSGPEGIKIPKFTDGTSNTIFVADATRDRAVIWTKPDDWDVAEGDGLKAIFGEHPGGTNFLFVDGSVRFFKDTLDPQTLWKLLTRDGGEVIGNEELQ